MKKIYYFLALLISVSSYAQIERVEPPNWWVGMENTNLELMIYGKNISEYTPKINDNRIELVKVKKSSNSNYLFLLLNLKKAKAGSFTIDFSKGEKVIYTYNYQLQERRKDSQKRVGFSNADAIYLVTPDRFANGNPDNDSVSSLRETEVDRTKLYARHGGDLQGITEHLDYISDLGFTALWVCPVLINDMPSYSYHGYAMTDLYKVDPRFGTLEDYKNLSKKAKEQGLKLIMDQVVNHIGIEHWWIKDLPDTDWINYQKLFENKQKIPTSNHQRTTNQDAYASKVDTKINNNGWFVDSMADLNQKNPLLATYLIQNSIWWVETLDLGGIRQDTYPYPDKNFMSKWAGAIMKEYPNFNIVGEEWSYNPMIVSYWQKGKPNFDGYQSNLPTVMDFPMQKAIADGIREKETWDTGLTKIYQGLANDFIYANPYNIMIFNDNHDMDRIFTQMNHNLAHTQMAVGLSFVLPRTPQMYYGTEVLFENTAQKGEHGLIRSDFWGGWKGDKKNAFTGTNLSKNEKEMQNFVKKLLNYRKNSQAIQKGKTVHFVPQNGIYFLFRIFEDETVVYILNKNEKPIVVDLERFKEIGLDGKSLRNIISDEKMVWKDKLTLYKEGCVILTTK
ncbi:MAG: glycoside hydrolase family 13 protein [Flavobacteriaceae bacterium]|nr:glycoside hydrolase family 13 protein [Flavobacteriaceae bacterium]